MLGRLGDGARRAGHAAGVIVHGLLLFYVALGAMAATTPDAAAWNVIVGWGFTRLVTGRLARLHTRPPLDRAGWAWLAVCAWGSAVWVARASTAGWDSTDPSAGLFLALAAWRWGGRSWRALRDQSEPAAAPGRAPRPARPRGADVAAWVEAHVPGPVVFGRVRGYPRLDWTGIDAHTLLDGPTGAGKTRRHLAQAVLAHGGPALVTSTKDDVAAYTTDVRALTGTCWWLDPSGRLAVPAHAVPVAARRLDRGGRRRPPGRPARVG